MTGLLHRLGLHGFDDASLKAMAAGLLRTIFCLFVVMAACQQASEQTLADPRPTNRRICDVNVTIVQGQSFTRNAQQDQLTLGSCTGTFTGTASFARGFAGPNGSDAGINDLYPTNGTTAPVSRGPDGPGGRWGTADGTYDFTFVSNAASGTGTTVDNFEVEVVTTAGRDSARIYYHVTITPPAAAVAPTVSQIDPASGGLGAAPGIVITGTDFTGTTSVTFGGVAATQFTIDSDTQITATAPAASAPGTQAVVVTNANGSSNATVAYRNYAAATNAAAFAPATVQTGATATLTFTLSSPGDNPGSLTQVAFSAAIPTDLTLTSPATTCGGTATIGGGTVSLSGGTLAAGASCTVTASASSSIAGSYSITPAAVSAQGTRAGASGSQSTVTGTAGTAATLTVSVPAPTITTVAPASGPAAGGTSVVITGTSFGGTTAVAFGGTAAASFTVDSSTQITAITPARSASTVDVAVTTPGGGATATGAYTFVAAPTVTAVSPSSGTTAGGTSVTITGTGLTGATAVTFGGAAATSYVVNSATQITATTPAGTAGAKSVAVTTPGGTGTLTNGYTYVALSAPAVTGQPANQTIAVGASATFSATASGTPSPAVQWQVSSDSGASFADVAGATATSYTTPAVTAADDGNRYRAVFTNSQGSVASNTATLSVVQAPVANDQAVTAAYQTARAITLIASDPNAPPRTLTYTILTAPAHGTLSGTSPNLTYTPAAGYSGPDSFTFRASNGVATSNVATVTITVQAPAPVVTSISPDQGSTAGGTAITINGSGFTGTTGVTIGGTPASAFSVASDTRITATTPAGAAGQASVIVTNATGSNAANTLFTYVAPATANDQTVAVAFNTARAVTLTATGTPTAYAVVTAPAHGTLSGTAPNLTYTPTTGYNGTDSFTFTASNAAGTSVPATVTLNVAPPAITIAGTPPAGTRGVAYSTTLTASGGTSPYSFAVVGGALPPGLSLTSGGTTATLSGTPTASGSFTVTIRALDSSNPGATAEATYTIAIAGPALTISPGPGALPTATVGTAYSQTVSAAGGTAPYSYAVTTGALPAGITLAPNGTLSGTSGTGGTFTFQVTATDSSANGGPYTASATYSLTVAAPVISIAPATLPNGAAGTAYARTLTATGGTAPYGFAVTGGTLPTGLTLSSAGALSGTPSIAGSFTFTVTATDASTGTGPYGSSRSYTVTITAPAITLAPATIPAGTVGQAYAQSLTATGGTGPYSYAVTAGTLPAGLTFGSDGALAGTPTAGGTFSFTVTGSDANGFTGSRAYSLTIAAPSLTLSPATLAAATRGVAYSQQITAAGGTAPYTFAITAGALPAGLTLSSTGMVAGTPTQAGSFSFTVSATDASTGAGPYAASRSYTLVVASPAISITPTALPAATTRIAYSQTLAATGGTAPYSYAVTAGTLPGGITLASDGTLSGTPIVAGSFAFTATASDANGNAGSRAYTLVVDAPTIAITPTSLPGGTVAQAYVQALTATGGAAPYAYAITAGTLPAGITLAADGTLSGTPTAGGTFTVQVTATDANGITAVRNYALTISGATIALAPAVLPDATRGADYTQAVTSTGGTAPYSYTATGTLPPGLTLSASGVISGRPTATGSYVFTITASDASTGSGPYSTSRSYTLTVGAAVVTVAPNALPPATTRIAYRETLSASGGTAPYGYAITAGTLPAGLTLASDGTLAGAATTAGTFAFTATVTDAAGNTGDRAYALVVTAPAIVLTPTALPVATTRIAYRQAVTATGGAAPYAYGVASGALPTGITLATDGTLSGTATTAGDFAFTVLATDASGNGGSRGYTLTVAAPAITLAPQSLADGRVGAAYTATFSTTGGTAPYAYRVSAGSLPAGIALGEDGTLSGTPTAGGRTSFTTTVTDANGNAASRAYDLTVLAAQVALSPEDLPAGQSGVAYSRTLSATGGTAPYAFAVTAGRLPAGLTLSATGTIAGTPTQSGSFAVTVTATDTSTGAGPYSVSRSYTLAITAPALTLTPVTVDAAQVGVAYRGRIDATGGTAPYSFRVSEGVLPTGIVLAADGTLSGTPTAGGSQAFTVTASDATTAGDGGPYTASRAYTLAVAAPTLAITPVSLPDGAYQAAYSQQLTTTGGTAPYRYRVTAGTLPAGLALSAEGLISGTPTAFGRFEATVTVTDGSTGTGPFSVTQAITLTIQSPAIPVVADIAVDVAYGSARTAIEPKVTTGVATDFTIVRQPAHGTASAEGATILYTPAAGYAGADGFTYAATNAGGTSAPATVSIMVGAPSVVVTQTTLPDARQGEAYDQQLTAAGGTAPYAFSVANGTLPAGLILSSTGRLSGTPTASGTASFTVRAIDASSGTGPFEGTRSYTLTVALPAAPTVRPVPPIDAAGSSTTTSGATDIVLSDYVTGTVTDIQLASPPSGGTVTLARTNARIVATYVARANFSGRDSFTVVAVGPGGRSAPLTVSLTVTGTTPVAASLNATTIQGVPVTVDLTTAATGGPFTAATVTAVSPTGQVGTRIVEGGTVSARTYALTLTPAVSFSGTATVTYTLDNRFGSSRAATITLTVTARPDPAADPTVNAMSAAQADATRRFVRAQTDNFTRRNDRLHHGGSGTGGIDIGNTMGLGFGGMMRPGQMPMGSGDPGEAKTQQAHGLIGASRIAGRMAGLPGATGTDATPGRTGHDAVPTQAESAGSGTAGSDERRIGSIGLWSGGAVTFGAWDADAERAKMAITTGGLSAGADVKLSDTLIAGVGGGYGHDATRIDGGRAHVRGDSWSFAGYGSWSPAVGLFVDGVVGAGSVSFDTRRRVDANGTVAQGDRDGRTIFGSLAAGLDRRSRWIDFSLYGRAEYLSARLHRFTEEGAGIYDLTFGRRKLDSITGVLGTRIALPMTGVTPRLRAEWRHEFADTGSQLVDYADVANLRYATRGDLWLRDAFTIDLGIDLDLGKGWNLTPEIGGTAGSGATAATGRVGVKKTF